MRASQFHLIVRRCQAARELSSAVYPSLAAINTTWADFINRRLKENLTLPEQLGDCENLSSVLRVYRAYCCTAAAQYQAVFAHLQLIGLNLASEVSAASLVPMRISQPNIGTLRALRIARRGGASHKHARAWFRLALHGTDPRPPVG